MTWARHVIERLYEQRPLFHGREAAGTRNYAIAREVLHWIDETLEEDWVSFETGCGYSTVLFAARGLQHLVVSPFAQEHEQIRRWCLKTGIPTASVTFVEDVSQRWLPRMDAKWRFNLVLIDGDHAFPAPFIDWYYTADRIKQHGYLVVDDTQLTTGSILKAFLLKETMRWACVQELGKTVIFQKLVDTQVAEGIPWIHQPYVRNENR